MKLQPVPWTPTRWPIRKMVALSMNQSMSNMLDCSVAIYVDRMVREAWPLSGIRKHIRAYITLLKMFQCWTYSVSFMGYEGQIFCNFVQFVMMFSNLEYNRHWKFDHIATKISGRIVNVVTPFRIAFFCWRKTVRGASRETSDDGGLMQRTSFRNGHWLWPKTDDSIKTFCFFNERNENASAVNSPLNSTTQL